MELIPSSLWVNVLTGEIVRVKRHTDGVVWCWSETHQIDTLIFTEVFTRSHRRAAAL